MKNALKNKAYLKHLNGRRFHYTSLVDRLDQMRGSLASFTLAICCAGKALQGFMHEALMDARVNKVYKR